jgi:acetyltransferase-like isoleucine patch superfamily enzyme
MNSGSDIRPPASIDARAVVAEDVSIGLGCVISSGAVLCSGVVLGSDVVVGPNAVFVESPSSASDGAAASVQDGVRIGANATIYAGISLATGCVVRPGSVVNRSVPPRAIVEGNPATIVGYVGTESGMLLTAEQVAPQPVRGAQETPVRGVTLHTFPVVPDLRGNLTVGEFSKEIPFTPLRYFMVFGVPSREVRGEHAHRECHQFLICVRGSCSVVADDGHSRIEAVLDAPNRGIYLPPMTWATQYKYSADALLLVFASHRYDAADYIRTYPEFTRLTGAK